MNEKKKYSGVELMGTAPVGTAIIRLALPMMVAMLAQAIYGITDAFFIGQTNDPNMIAAVSLAFPLYMFSIALGNVFAIGGSSYISRMLGEKKNDEARNTSAVSFYSGFGVAVLMVIALWIFKTPILWMIGASNATFAYTDDYFSAVLLGMAFAATGIIMSGQMRSEGAAQKAMILQLIGVVLNIVLDPVFIIWFGWGTAGAGWATVVAQFVSFIYGIHYFFSKSTVLSIKPMHYKPNGTMMGQMLSIGIPAGISNFFMSVANILANRIAADYGDHVVAGYGIQMRVGSIFFLLILALAIGFQPFAGYNYGAKQFDRLHKGFKLTLIYTTALCLFGCAVLSLFGDNLMKVFIDDPHTIEAGAALLWAFIWGLPFLGVQMTLMVSFQALGKPIQATIITLGRQLLFYLPLLYLLNYLFGFDGFAWSQPAADVLTTGIAVVLGFSLLKLMRGAGDSATVLTT